MNGFKEIDLTEHERKILQDRGFGVADPAAPSLSPTPELEEIPVTRKDLESIQKNPVLNEIVSRKQEEAAINQAVKMDFQPTLDDLTGRWKQARFYDPNAIAPTLAIAKEKGIPLIDVLTDIKLRKELDVISQDMPDFQEINKYSPAVAGWLVSNVQNMFVARDDLEPLTLVEKVIRVAKRLGRGTTQTLGKNIIESMRGAALNTFGYEDPERNEWNEARLRVWGEPVSEGRDQREQAGGDTPNIPKADKKQLQLTPTGKMIEHVYDQTMKANPHLTPEYIPYQKGAFGVLERIVEAAPQYIAGGIIAAATGMPSLGAAFMGGQIYGASYGQMREQNVPHDKASINASGNALFQMPLEYMGYGPLTRLTFKGAWANAGLSLLKTGTAEGTTEFLQQFPDAWFMLNGLMYDKDLHSIYEQYMADMPETIKEGLMEGLVGFMLGIVGGGGIGAVRDYRSAKIAQADLSVLDSLADQAKKSKLATRSPEAYESAVEAMDNGETRVYIDGETFYQTYGDKSEKQAKKLGVSKEQLEEAVDTGGRIEVPLSKWQAQVAPSEEYMQLRDQIALRPDGPTARESAETKARAEAGMKKALDESKAVLDAQTEEGESARQVLDDFKYQILGASGNKMTEQEASEISLVMATRSIISSRILSESGNPTTPWDWYKSRGIAVVDSVAEGGEVYNQDDLEPWQIPLNTWVDDNLDVKQWQRTQQIIDDIRKGKPDDIKESYFKKGSTFDTDRGYARYIEANFDKLPKDLQDWWMMRPGYRDAETGEWLTVPEAGVRGTHVYNARDWDNIDLVAREKHKDIVKQALSEGKSVPPEVLKDYPELSSYSVNIHNQDEIKLDLEALRQKFKQVDPETFIIQRDKSKKRKFLTPYTSEQMKESQIYLTDDGVGFALTPEKDMVGVFNNSGKPGAGREAVTLAIAEGAETCDCVAGFLDEYYNNFGFITTDVAQWDDSLAPEGWDYERYGRPDINFFKYPEELSRDPRVIAGRLELARAERSSGRRGGRGLDLEWHKSADAEVRQRLDQEKQSSAGRGTGNTGGNVTPSEQIELNQPLGKDRGAFSMPRGQVNISQSKAIITLFKNADMSTALHEMAHIFLADMADLAMQENIPEWLGEDMDTIREWLGVGEDGVITEAMHEQFARGFEAYLREGRAPSSALQRAFTSFRKWLLQIYSSVKSLNVDVSPEMKGVFDRLIATQEEIDAQVSQAQYDMEMEAYRNMVSEADEMLAELNEAEEKATQTTEDKVFNTVYARVRDAQEEWLRGEKALARERAEKEIATERVYSAIARMSAPKAIRLSEKEIKNDPRWGEGIINSLPPGVVAKRGGIHPDIIAPEMGYGSGDEMMKDISQAKSLKEAVDERVASIYESYLLENGAMDEDEIASLVREHMENADYLDVMLIQREIIQDMAEGPVKENLEEDATARKQAMERMAQRRQERKAQRQAMERAAENVADNRPYLTLDARKYFANARRAARQAVDLMAKGDKQAALEAKNQQMLNYLLGMKTAQAKAEANRIDKQLARFQNAKKRKGLYKVIDSVQMDQIDKILERFSFKKRSGPQLKRLQSLASWITEQENASEVVAIVDKLRDEAFRKNWKQMSLNELREVRDAVANIEHIGRTKKKLLKDRQGRTIEQKSQAAADQIHANHKTKDNKYKTPSNEKVIERVTKSLKGMHFEFSKVEFICRHLDGHVNFGPVWHAVFDPILEGDRFKMEEMAKATDKLQELFEILKGDDLTKKHWVPALDQNVTLEELISLALNWGNEGNRQRVMAGQKWDGGMVQEALDILEERHWEFVQEAWNYIDSWWPQMDQLTRRLTGIPLDKVQASPVYTKYGVLKGGYFPIVYDPNWSDVAAKHSEQKAMQEQATSYFENPWFKPSTNKGATIARMDEVHNRPLLLSLGTIGLHLEQVIHDLSFREAVRDVDRIINNEIFKEAVLETVGREAYKQFTPWLQRVARDPVDPFQTGTEKAIRRLNTGMTYFALGLKLSVAAFQTLSVFNAAPQIGSVRTGKAIIRLLSAQGAWPSIRDQVFEQSVEMRNRGSQYDRDVRSVLRGIKSKKKLAVAKASFALVGMMDSITCVAIWTEAYDQAMCGQAENVQAESEAAAREYADMIVRTTQPAGRAKDLALVQRRGGLMDLLTKFYTPWSNLYNIWSESIASTDFKKPGDVGKFMGDCLFTWFMPAVVMVAMKSAMGKAPDDEDDYIKWALGMIATWPIQSIPVARDIMSSILNYVSGWRWGSGYTFSPVTSALEAHSKLGVGIYKTLAGDGDIEDIAKPALELIGYWGQLPTQQVNKIIWHLTDYMGGEDLDVRKILF